MAVQPERALLKIKFIQEFIFIFSPKQTRTQEMDAQYIVPSIPFVDRAYLNGVQNQKFSLTISKILLGKPLY